MSLVKSFSWVNAVDEFWFQELNSSDWFGGGPRIDALIRERFGGLRESLKHAPPVAELLDARGLVAAVVVFDQFSRNLFRGSAESYATDSLALALASFAVNNAMNESLDLDHRHFLYMPFMHSESQAMQAQSMKLFLELGDAELTGYATQHKAVIDSFGRFPSRNAALGRESTAAEEAFLLKEKSRA